MKNREAPKTWREYVGKTVVIFSNVRWIWREFMTARARKLVVVAVFIQLFLTGLFAVWPYMTAFVVDGLSTANADLIYLGIGGIIAVVVVSQALEPFNQMTGDRLETELDIGLQTKLSRMFFGKSLGQHLGDSQELSPANIRKGVHAVSFLQMVAVYNLFGTITRIIVCASLIAWLHWLGGVAAVAYVLYFLAWSVYLNYRAMKDGEAAEKAMRAVDRYMDERWRNVERVKACGQEDVECRRHIEQLTAANQQYLRVSAKLSLFGAVRAETSSAPFFIGTFVLGVFAVLHGDWTVGQLVPFVAWSSNLMNAMGQLSNVERRLQRQLPYIDTLRQIMELEPAVSDAPDAVTYAPQDAIGVEFDGVGFTHPGKDGKPDKPVLRGVTFSVMPGEKVAVLGPTGAGKTTLLHMLLRSRDPDEGSVKFGGIDLRQMTQSSFKRYVGYAPQGAPLFDGTIRELMLYGLTEDERARLNDQDIWSALRAVKADFGERLADGLSTKIGRDGIELSGGERQRLSAAMALMNPRLRLLIMDEPTSSLDAETQRGFQDGLQAALGKGVTAFIVAHRLSTVKDCDKFVVLRPVTDLADGEPQVEAIASSLDELYGRSETFRRMADGEGLRFGLPDAGLLLFSGTSQTFRA